jgi:hypothetical protein
MARSIHEIHGWNDGSDDDATIHRYCSTGLFELAFAQGEGFDLVVDQAVELVFVADQDEASVLAVEEERLSMVHPLELDLHHLAWRGQYGLVSYLGNYNKAA